jgi:hypothetical protein
MINPFDAGGYTLAEMTTAINILPNVYTRLGAMGLAYYHWRYCRCLPHPERPEPVPGPGQ